MTDTLPLNLSGIKRTPGAPHYRNSLSVNGMVILYIVASVPCFFMGLWQSGRGLAGLDASSAEILIAGILLIGPRLVVLLGLGYGLAKLYQRIRNRPTDIGWLGVSWFFLLLLPPAIDVVPAMVALTFALVFVLFVFGGQGMSPFHATLAAVIFLNVAFGYGDQSVQIAPHTSIMSSWHAALDASAVDGFDFSIQSLQSGSLGVMSPVMVLLGGVFLLLTGIASYRVIIAAIAGAVLASLLLDAPAGSHAALGAWYGHLLVGNFLFVLVFLASDPACQPLTRQGRWIAGFAFGGLTVLLRVLDPAHPEGSLMALLLVSLCIPVVDAMVVRFSVWRRRVQHHG